MLEEVKSKKGVLIPGEPTRGDDGVRAGETGWGNAVVDRSPARGLEVPNHMDFLFLLLERYLVLLTCPPQRIPASIVTVTPVLRLHVATAHPILSYPPPPLLFFMAAVRHLVMARCVALRPDLPVLHATYDCEPARVRMERDRRVGASYSRGDLSLTACVQCANVGGLSGDLREG